MWLIHFLAAQKTIASSVTKWPHLLPRSDPEEARLLFCDGSVWLRPQCLRGFGQWVDAILEFSAALQKMSLDVATISCLCSLVLLTGEAHHTSTYTCLVKSSLFKCITCMYKKLG